MKHVPAAIKQRVEAKLRECIALAEKEYRQKFAFPNIRYDVRGTTAGYAHLKEWLVRFNPVLLVENVDEFIARTVPHELAHLITDRVYPHAHQGGFKVVGYGAVRRKKRSVHGVEWQSVMRALGVSDVTRCHSYDTKNAAVKKKNRYTYVCQGCQAEIQAGPKIHAQLQRRPNSRWHNGCKGHALVYKPAGAKTVQLVKQATPVPAVPVMATVGSKIDRARELYKANKHMTRAELMALFIIQLNMTPAGASTYVYTVTKG